MARRTNPSTAKVFGLVLTIAFGLIALVVGYAALKGGLELRSKAALPPQTIVKAWEFKEDEEGWFAPTPYAWPLYAENGFLKFGISVSNPSVIEHTGLSDLFPQPWTMSLTMKFTVFPPTVAPSPYPTTSSTWAPLPSQYPSTTPTWGPPPVIEEPVLGVQTTKGPNVICAQVITYARSNDGECKAFATPCDVPAGWVADKSCTISAAPSRPPGPPFSPFTFSLQLSYRLNGKILFEKPLSTQFTVKSAKGEEFTATFPLPVSTGTPIEVIDIGLSKAPINTRIEVDWIRFTTPVLKATPTPTPPKGCKYQQVTCVKAPCDAVLVCPSSPTPTPDMRRKPDPTPTKKSQWCKIVKLLPGGTSSKDYKKDCL